MKTSMERDWNKQGIYLRTLGLCIFIFLFVKLDSQKYRLFSNMLIFPREDIVAYAVHVN